MACATLKRSLDWEALNQRPTKRRRCNPYSSSGGAAGSSSSSAAAALASYQYARSSIATEPATSAFDNTPSCPKLTPEKMAQNIREEITRLQRSKQLKFTSANLERMQDSDNSGSEMGADSPRRPDTPPTTSSADKGLFSFKQVQLICKNMLKDQEDHLREQYETVLATKLAEQYDTYVKFTYDQIQRRYEAAPSYLS